MEHCKYCEAEMEEGSTLCPACGKDNVEAEEAVVETVEETAEEKAEETAEEVVEEAAEENKEESEEKNGEKAEEKVPAKSKRMVMMMAAAMAVLVVILGALVYGGMKKPFIKETVPVLGTIPADSKLNDETYRGSYSTRDRKVTRKRGDVVATAGEYELTVGQLQIYYWQEVISFLNQYGAYAPYFGLDYTQPLDTQACGIMEGRTWQQYFLARALNSWRSYTALSMMAKEAGYEMEPEYYAELNAIPARLQQQATAYGFKDAESYVQANVGAGSSVADYVKFMEIYYLGYSYLNHYHSTLTATDAEVEEFFTLHEKDYAQSGLTKETKTVDVRHILIYPDGATDATIRTETFSEEAWAAAEEKAYALLQQWAEAEGANEESFGKLADAHTQDGGSKGKGGLYTNVSQGTMVENFDAWCFDPERKVGDTAVVKTEYGYHVMFFCGETYQWRELVRTDVINEKLNTMVDAAIAKLPITVFYDKILLSVVDLTQ